MRLLRCAYTQMVRGTTKAQQRRVALTCQTWQTWRTAHGAVAYSVLNREHGDFMHLERWCAAATEIVMWPAIRHEYSKIPKAVSQYKPRHPRPPTLKPEAKRPRFLHAQKWELLEDMRSMEVPLG